MTRHRVRGILWKSRQAKRLRIRKAMMNQGTYTERSGRTWRYRRDLGDDIVQVGESIWPDLDAALDAEV